MSIKRRTLLFLASASTVFVASSAAAQAPLQLKEPGQYSRPGAAIWANSLSVGTSTAAYVTYAGSEKMLFPNGTAVVAVNNGTSAARCCWVGIPNAVLGAGGAATTNFQITDVTTGYVNGTGRGACFSMPAASSVVKTVSWEATAFSPGYRNGVCSLATSNVRYNRSVYGTCGSTAHCASIGGMAAGATCLTAAADIRSLLYPNGIFSSDTTAGVRGLYLTCRAEGTVMLDFGIEQ